VADIYGVTPQDIADELPGVYPAGFSVATKPPLAKVTSLISTADAIAALRVTKATDAPPSAAAAGAVVPRRFIIAWTAAKVLRIRYTGNPPAEVDAAARPFEVDAKDTLDAIDMMGEQGQDTGTPFIHVRGAVGDREMLISDATLGAAARGGNLSRPF
jgi:hypothetical protein